jgi:hypothetical protein
MRRYPRIIPAGRSARTRSRLAGVLATVVAAALLPATAAAHATTTGGPNPVSQWNANAIEAATAACFTPGVDGNPPAESRLYAMTHIAVHDALNGIDRRFRPYAVSLHGYARASVPAAVAAAARGVLVPGLTELSTFLPPQCVAAGVASVETDYAAALAAIPDGPARAAGIRLGERAAAAVRDLRTDDGSDTLIQDPNYPQGTRPGEYRFTPGVPFAFAPGWGDVTPFTLRDSAQFRPGPPYPVSSRRYAADLAEVKRLGGDGVTTPSARTADQTDIALFWVGSSPYTWNAIARQVADRRGLDPWQSARLFGLLNMALADGYIATFDTKYHYNYWRPVTAIHLADADGNPATSADPTWTPLVPTPPVPDYDSGHSVQGGVAAAVLKQFFHTDRIPFAICSPTMPAGRSCGESSPAVRRFATFSQAADENGVSRILVGFHFRKAVNEGIDHGRKIGVRAVARYLPPAD